jgi:predicted GIY-YIG superfamily endonuclease
MRISMSRLNHIRKVLKLLSSEERAQKMPPLVLQKRMKRKRRRLKLPLLKRKRRLV